MNDIHVIYKRIEKPTEFLGAKAVSRSITTHPEVACEQAYL